MISIPVAVYNRWFEWQLDLFWHNHKKLYGLKAYKKAHAIVIRRNSDDEVRCESYDWAINVPHTLCESYFDYWKEKTNRMLVPINIQIGLIQILNNFDDNDVLELLDCDVFHFKKHPPIMLQHNEMYVSDLYEEWHLFSKSKYKYLIEKYFKNGGGYYNGGFVPIIATAKTFKTIIEDWIWIHKDLIKTLVSDEFHNLRWWAGMYSLQAACERHRVQMIAQDFCYIPGANSLSHQQYMGHYSVDRHFDKRKYPSIKWNDLPNNEFYNATKNWKNKTLSAELPYKFFI
jgi:hypothetical protein